MYCTNCGQQADSQDIFCSSCGVKYNESVSDERIAVVNVSNATIKPLYVPPPQSTQIPGIGSYFLAIFLTPVYFFMRGKTVPGIITTILYIISVPMMMALFLGIFFWGFAAVWGGWALRNEILEAHAKRTGEETARAIFAAQQQR